MKLLLVQAGQVRHGIFTSMHVYLEVTIVFGHNRGCDVKNRD